MIEDNFLIPSSNPNMHINDINTKQIFEKFKKVLTKKKCSYIIQTYQTTIRKKERRLYMRIKNKKKFIKSITILCLAILIIAVIGIKNIYSNTTVSYKEEYVLKGETLWSIAEKQTENNKYYYNKDIREVVSHLKNINHLENANLKEGQKILVPTL